MYIMVDPPQSLCPADSSSPVQYGMQYTTTLKVNLYSKSIAAINATILAHFR